MSLNNQFLLQDILTDLMDAGKSLNSSLMKVKYFALRTKNTALEKFATREVEGYTGLHPKEVPEYRKAPATLFLDISIMGQMKRIEAQPDILDNPEYREPFEYAVFREGISTIEKIEENLTAFRKQEPYIGVPIPMNYAPYFEEALTKQHTFPVRMHGGHMAANPYRIHEISPTVRSRLINFVSDLADEFGFEINITKYNENQASNNQIVYKIMNHTEITGDGNVINSGNNASISANININKNDLATLQSALESQGIDKADIEELSKIVQEENPTNGSLGQGAIDWILKISSKALKGIGKIATGVSSSLLATFIKKYYGIDD